MIIQYPESRNAVYADVEHEVQIQEDTFGTNEKRASQPGALWLVVLVEEVGEAAHELCEEWNIREADLRKELVQVAAVAVSWIEALDSKPDPNE